VTPSYESGDRVKHRVLGAIGTVTAREPRPDSHVPGWWYTVEWDIPRADNDPERNTFAERVLLQPEAADA
jgi:hypothetical protein